MFVGHLGLAYLGKAARRDVPLLLLIISSYLPDIARLLLSFVGRPSELLSHSIPAVAVLGVAIGALWSMRAGAPVAAALLALLCVLHWPADMLTGCKPTLPDGPWIGYNGYRRPVTDLLAELSLLTLGWLACHRNGLSETRLAYRWWVIAVAIGVQFAFLANLYAGSEFFVGNREWTWHPTEGQFTLKRVPDTEELPCRPPPVQ